MVIRRLKKTHEHLAKLFMRVPTLKDIFARPFGITPKTVESWGRPKSSPDELWATGKGNPLDRVEKLMEEAHPYDPETVREIAEHFPQWCDELDRRAGISEADEDVQPCAAMARVAKKHLDLVLTGLGSEYDRQTVTEALKQTKLLKSYVIQLESCLDQLKNNYEGEKEDGNTFDNDRS